MTSNNFDVIVIGGGISGLTAAYTLKKKLPSVKVVVLEGKDRVGGRTVTLPLVGANGTDRWDLGGQWVGKCQTHVMQLISELGLETYSQYTTGSKLQQLGGSKVTSYSSDIPSLSLWALVDLYRFLAKLDKYRCQLDTLDPCSHPKAQEWDALTVAAFMDKTLYTSGAREAVEAACRVVFGCEADQISFLFYLVYLGMAGGIDKIIEAKEDTAQEARVKGGAQQISISLAERLGKDSVRLGDPVQLVKQRDDGVDVVTLSGWRGTCSYVIVATPPAAMDHIHFEPKLGSVRRSLIKHMPMGNLTKIILTYQTAFWRDNGLSGEVVSSGGNSELFHCPKGPVCICYDAGTEQSSPALVAFIGGDLAVTYATMTAKTRQEAVLNHLSTFFGPQVRKFLDYTERDWNLEPFSWGAPVSYLSPGAMHLYAATVRRPEGRLHFAGTEAATVWTGYMSGAIQAGEATALSVLQRFNPGCLSVADRETMVPFAARLGDSVTGNEEKLFYASLVRKDKSSGGRWFMVASVLCCGVVGAVVFYKYTNT